MTRRRRVHVVLGATLAVAAVAVAGVAVIGLERESEEGVEPEFPTALGKHLEKLGEAAPDVKTEEGPDSRAAWKFDQQAYPVSDIALSKIQAARVAAKTAAGCPFPKGKGQKGTWVSVGPETALYPFTELRNSYSYVPNAYVASGRTTVLAIAPSCKPGNCRLWAGAAGGGIWTTKNALTGQPTWQFVSGSFGIQAVSSITVDPNDPSGADTVWVWGREANASGDSAAGVGLYKTTDGGATWDRAARRKRLRLPRGRVDRGRPGEPEHRSTRRRRGCPRRRIRLRGRRLDHSGRTPVGPLQVDQWRCVVDVHPQRRPDPRRVHRGHGRGDELHAVLAARCPSGRPRSAEPEIVYAASYARGVWRSADGGATWTQINASLELRGQPDPGAIAVTTLPNGKTRMYVFEGNAGQNYCAVLPHDDVSTGAPVFTDLTSPSVSSTGFATFGTATAQCWYDSFVYTPKGSPDIVYVLGDYTYGETVANKRGVILSTDAGVSGTDMTYDGTDQLHPNGMHPDQHSLVTVPGNPFQFIETSDGGIVRSSGELVDRSSWCDDPNRGLSGAALARCKQMLSKIPSELQSMNKGLSTLQFQSLSVSPQNSNVLQGGTQDNGTWQTNGNPVEVGEHDDRRRRPVRLRRRDSRVPLPHLLRRVTRRELRQRRPWRDWNWTGDPSTRSARSRGRSTSRSSRSGRTGWMFAGLAHVWRTKTARPGVDDHRRVPPALQRVDRGLRGPVR